MFIFFINAAYSRLESDDAEDCQIYSTENLTINGINATLKLDSNYNFTLHNCKPNACYAIMDTTYRMRFGVENIYQSIFKSVYLGNANHLLKPSGIAFKPLGSTVQLNFTTIDENTFYKLHPFELNEDLTEFNISTILSFVPICDGL